LFYKTFLFYFVNHPPVQHNLHNLGHVLNSMQTRISNIYISYTAENLLTDVPYQHWTVNLSMVADLQ